MCYNIDRYVIVVRQNIVEKNPERNLPLERDFVDLSTVSLGDFLKEALKEEVFTQIKDSMRIIVQGIDIDLALPLAFASLNFSCLDNFLYISLVPK